MFCFEEFVESVLVQFLPRQYFFPQYQQCFFASLSVVFWPTITPLTFYDLPVYKSQAGRFAIVNFVLTHNVIVLNIAYCPTIK